MSRRKRVLFFIPFLSSLFSLTGLKAECRRSHARSTVIYITLAHLPRTGHRNAAALFPFALQKKKKKKEKEKENNCPLLIKSLYRRIIMNFPPSGTEPPEALRLSESALFIAFDSNIYPPRVYSEIPPASVLAARLIPLMLFILCFLLCFRHAVTLLAGRSVYTKGFASEFYRILRGIHRAPQQPQQEEARNLPNKVLAARSKCRKQKPSLIRREATE